MTITVTASGISLDGPLVAGEVVAVSVSGVAFAADAKPTLCLLGRFPDALLSSVELAEDENTPGTWTGELDTATKQTAAFFAAARADEKRDAVLELVAARQSIVRLSVPMANSALCPSPFHAPDASPVYVPVPGPPGAQGAPGPLRGRQYAYTVADGDTIHLPADATSVVLSTSDDFPSVELVPPTLADGEDFSLFAIVNSSLGLVRIVISNATCEIHNGEMALFQRNGAGFISREFPS
jgi:hypothetical protein